MTHPLPVLCTATEKNTHSQCESRDGNLVSDQKVIVVLVIDGGIVMFFASVIASPIVVVVIVVVVIVVVVIVVSDAWAENISRK